MHVEPYLVQLIFEFWPHVWLLTANSFLQEINIWHRRIYKKNDGVEAAAISALVSGTLKVVGNKLAPLLIKEYSSIVGVKEDLQELHDLVEGINFWLEKTAENSIGSTQSFAWLKKLKDISYDVDDVVDERLKNMTPMVTVVLCPNTCAQYQNHLFFNATQPTRSRQSRRDLLQS